MLRQVSPESTPAVHRRLTRRRMQSRGPVISLNGWTFAELERGFFLNELDQELFELAGAHICNRC